ncbi:MAG: AarF/UbiB family protein, partial [Ferruginibacter sp.]
MDKYCCFKCPSKDYTEKDLSDLCPVCGLPYGFPLQAKYLPKRIGEFKVEKALNRGFYGATYIVEKQTSIRKKKMVLKVVPKEIYVEFRKDFAKECTLHAEVAEGAQHIVNIEDVFDDVIDYGGTKISCHVAILEFIEGETLKNILDDSKAKISASEIAQIAIDLLKILIELNRKHKFHNDLHRGNIIIQRLKEEEKRASGEIDEYIKAVAIDFGSLDYKSQSGDKSNRLSDLHWVADTLNTLSQRILENPYISEERDYRLA